MNPPKEITWSAPEYHYYEKGAQWHGALAVITGALALVALWQRNFLFAIFIVLAGFLVSSWGKRAPKTVPFSLREKELTINSKQTHLYEKCEGFAIIETPDHPIELVFKTRERLHPSLRIIISPEMEGEIREFLTARLPEIEHVESLGERIGRMLKF